MVVVDGVNYATSAKLVTDFEQRKSRLYSKYAKRAIDQQDADYKWMWDLIKGHNRAQEKTRGATTFRLYHSNGINIYLLDQANKPLKDSRGKWVHVGKDGLIFNRFKANDCQPHRLKVFRVFRDLVADQIFAFRAKKDAVGRGKEVHVGHGAQGSDHFSSMLVRFLRKSGFTAPDPFQEVNLERASSQSGEYKLASSQAGRYKGDQLATMWCTFHRDNARLKMQNAHDNMSDNYNNKRKLWELTANSSSA